MCRVKFWLISITLGMMTSVCFSKDVGHQPSQKQTNSASLPTQNVVATLDASCILNVKYESGSKIEVPVVDGKWQLDKITVTGNGKIILKADQTGCRATDWRLEVRK